MSAKILELNQNSTPLTLARNLVELVEEGNVAWMAMVIVDKDGNIRHEWTHLPNNLAAVGAAELLKDAIKQQV